MSSQILFGSLGGAEMILIAAIALLLAGASRLFSGEKGRRGEERDDAARVSRPASYQERGLSHARASALEIVVP